MHFTTVVATILLSFSLAVVNQVPDKASPFTAVKWDGDRPIVRFEGEWYQFEKIDDIPVETLIAFCKKEYEKRWQKRFSEDFVEVLTTFGHTPKVTVVLTLSKDGKSFSKSGTMSKENRRKIRDYNRDGPEPLREQRVAKPAKSSVSAGMATQMAAHSDRIWDSKPQGNIANIRFLFLTDGKPFAGKVDIHGEFIFRARAQEVHQQAFNPNSNGRWVFENLPPGTYDLSISGLERFDNWEWQKKAVNIEAGSAPLFEVSVALSGN